MAPLYLWYHIVWLAAVARRVQFQKQFTFTVGCYGPSTIVWTKAGKRNHVFYYVKAYYTPAQCYTLYSLVGHVQKCRFVWKNPFNKDKITIIRQTQSGCWFWETRCIEVLLLKVVPPHFPAFNRAISRIDGVKEWNGRVVVDVSTACTFSTLFCMCDQCSSGSDACEKNWLDWADGPLLRSLADIFFATLLWWEPVLLYSSFSLQNETCSMLTP